MEWVKACFVIWKPAFYAGRISVTYPFAATSEKDYPFQACFSEKIHKATNCVCIFAEKLI